MRFLDVGQGDSAVVELPGGRVVVIDGGGFGHSRFDVGQRVIAPYLWSRRILRVDSLVATHGDWDHQGGLHFLAREFAPRELWIGARSRREGETGPARRRRCGKAAASFVRCCPARPRPRQEMCGSSACTLPPEVPLSANDSSLVLRLIAGERSRALHGRRRGDGRGGHGIERSAVSGDACSKFRTMVARRRAGRLFLRWTKPAFAVFSLGAGNSYGFPHPAVLARYRRFGTRILRTDREGSVGVSIGGGRLALRPESAASPILCSLFGALC